MAGDFLQINNSRIYSKNIKTQNRPKKISHGKVKIAVVCINLYIYHTLVYIT